MMELYPNEYAEVILYHLAEGTDLGAGCTVSETEIALMSIGKFDGEDDAEVEKIWNDATDLLAFNRKVVDAVYDMFTNAYLNEYKHREFDLDLSDRAWDAIACHFDNVASAALSNTDEA